MNIPTKILIKKNNTKSHASSKTPHAGFLSLYSRLIFIFVKFSGDESYVISGSDNTNIRIWKTKVSEQLGVVR
ncbi:hypothetical protein LR48_Vigan04g144900 [Vigna angularis]|uniref:Uncharacterized protein n=1 Tax=Phaseolus angularis TaxID=3914 RepID=A0A0L9UEU8_PHAAN|nr:hypothetical protein LR48_Vigan04g144900 [Vigna angularis]